MIKVSDHVKIYDTQILWGSIVISIDFKGFWASFSLYMLVNQLIFQRKLVSSYWSLKFSVAQLFSFSNSYLPVKPRPHFFHLSCWQGTPADQNPCLVCACVRYFAVISCVRINSTRKLHLIAASQFVHQVICPQNKVKNSVKSGNTGSNQMCDWPGSSFQKQSLSTFLWIKYLVSVLSCTWTFSLSWFAFLFNLPDSNLEEKLR